MPNQEELLRLTRNLLDLKIEKKNMNKTLNEQIKALDALIAECVKEDVNQ